MSHPAMMYGFPRVPSPPMTPFASVNSAGLLIVMIPRAVVAHRGCKANTVS